jgi:hypothetical protein
MQIMFSGRIESFFAFKGTQITGSDSVKIVKSNYDDDDDDD